AVAVAARMDLCDAGTGDQAQRIGQAPAYRRVGALAVDVEYRVAAVDGEVRLGDIAVPVRERRQRLARGVDRRAAVAVARPVDAGDQLVLAAAQGERTGQRQVGKVLAEHAEIMRGITGQSQ